MGPVCKKAACSTYIQFLWAGTPETWQCDTESRSPSQGTMVTIINQNVPTRMGSCTAS